MDKRFIIGIAGHKNSGKSTVSNMIRYILEQGILNVSFKEWSIKYENANDDNCGTVINFADFLKDSCSIIFDIPRSLFDDRNHKDNKYFLIDSKIFVSEKANILNEYKVLRIEDFDNELTLADYIDFNKGKVAIKLRTILQYVGTNIFRNCINRDIFVNITINNAISIKNNYGYCIIGDVRFENESNSIKQRNGYIIEIKRNSIESNDSHDSEKLENINADIIINNDSTKFDLFYKVFSAINYILNQPSTGERKQITF